MIKLISKDRDLGTSPIQYTLDIAVVVYPCCILLAFTDENVLLKYSHEIDELLSLQVSYTMYVHYITGPD